MMYLDLGDLYAIYRLMNEHLEALQVIAKGCKNECELEDITEDIYLQSITLGKIDCMIKDLEKKEEKA